MTIRGRRLSVRSTPALTERRENAMLIVPAATGIRTFIGRPPVPHLSISPGAFPWQPVKAKPLTQWLRWRVLADCALWLWKSFACPLRPITEISNTARHRLATANSICRKYNLFLHLQKSRLGLPSWRAVSYHSIPAPKPAAASRGFCAPYQASCSPAPCGRCRHGAFLLRRLPTTAWEFAQAAP